MTWKLCIVQVKFNFYTCNDLLKSTEAWNDHTIGGGGIVFISGVPIPQTRLSLYIYVNLEQVEAQYTTVCSEYQNSYPRSMLGFHYWIDVNELYHFKCYSQHAIIFNELKTKDWFFKNR